MVLTKDQVGDLDRKDEMMGR